MNASQLPKVADNLNQIQLSSRKIIKVLRIWRGAIPLASALVWSFINQMPDYATDKIIPDFVRMPLPIYGRVLAFAITMISIGITMYGITVLIRLFRLYQDGKIFHYDSVRCLQTLSKVLIALCFAGILTDILMSLTLTLHHPPGAHTISIGITSQDITHLIVGAILATIARVMLEACKMKEEQDLIV